MAGLVDSFHDYNGVVDTADVHGWQVLLHHDAKTKLWALSVYDRGELMVRSTSTLMAPGCFVELGREARNKLDRSGRLA